MSGTLTIRNLDLDVKQKLRELAARHQRSMEAEARAILGEAVREGRAVVPETTEEARERLKGIIGIWQDRGTTDELMQQTRGEE